MHGNVLLALVFTSAVIGAEEDYYERLGVERSASDEDIKKAFRQLSKIYHPDKTQNDENATEKFLKIKEAYEALTAEKLQKDDKVFKWKVKRFDVPIEELFRQAEDGVFVETENQRHFQKKFSTHSQEEESQNFFQAFEDLRVDIMQPKINRKNREQKRVELQNNQWLTDEFPTDSNVGCKVISRVVHGQSHISRICS